MKKRDEFINENLPLVHSLCRRFAGRGVEYDDLFQVGCIGLIKAADGFDESRGLKFSTYAFPVIMGELRRLFRDGGFVKVSRSVRELSMKASRAAAELSTELSREPTVSEIACRIGAEPDEVAEAVAAARPVVSLTAPEDGGEMEFLMGDNSKSSEIGLERIALKSAVDELPEQDKNIIVLRYFKAKTQSETAKILGMSQVGVSRRERKILSEMREKLA